VVIIVGSLSSSPRSSSASGLGNSTPRSDSPPGPPNNAKLAAQADTVFKGETLRGLLLNAYAFGTMGTIAGIAAIAAFIAAAVMLVLGGLGLIHARRTSPDTDILTSRTAHTPEPGTAPVPATLNGATASPTLHPSARPATPPDHC
jgi:hypothetical protein